CQSGTSPGGTITFSVGGIITLDPAKGPLPTITTNVTVDGADMVGISGANTRANGTRIFNVATGATLTLQNILLERAYSANGDGSAMQVFDGPTVTINKSSFSKNQALHGGAIYVSTNATLNANDSTFSGNSSAHTGGAIDNAGTAILSRVTLDHNSTDPEAGG